jgi:two-component system NarL family response regulator
MTSVLVVDDAVLFQAGLTSALGGAGLDVVGEAQDAMAAVAKASQLQPDVVVLDVLMPGISGLEVVDKIILAAPKTKVVLLTSSESGEDLLAAIRSGAMGYIVKTTPLPELVAGIEAVVHGGAVVSPAMLGKLFGTVAQLLRHKDVVSARKPALTGREVEVLQFIARGLTSREIGERLYISENTVKNHVRNVLDKLGLHSRGEAVMYALREELISMD